MHALEYATFLLTELLFWALIADIGGAARGARNRPGRRRPALSRLRVLLLFTAAMQGVFLSALMTFARVPWYDGYAETTRAWGQDPLADQKLAGVIMWIPGGVIYLVTALLLLPLGSSRANIREWSQPELLWSSLPGRRPLHLTHQRTTILDSSPVTDTRSPPRTYRRRWSPGPSANWPEQISSSSSRTRRPSRGPSDRSGPQPSKDCRQHGAVDDVAGDQGELASSVVTLRWRHRAGSGDPSRVAAQPQQKGVSDAQS